MKKIQNSVLVVFLLTFVSLGAFFLQQGSGITNLLKKRSQVSVDMKHLEGVSGVMPVVIVGSGPAALSAALYSARLGNQPLVISGDKPGGALTETSYVENWPGRKKVLGAELIGDLREQAKSFGTEFLSDTVDSIDFSTWPYAVHTQSGKTIYALSVVLSTGSSPRPLGVSGEREYWGKGVTTCAICDAPFHKGNDVVVVGGGDSAAEEAMQLAPYAQNITILVRKDHMRAAAAMQDRLKEYPNITVQYNTAVTAIEGDGNEVTQVQLKDTKTGAQSVKPVKGVFLAIGHEPNSALVKDAVKTDKNGYVSLIGRSQQTSQAGVFAAGDVEDGQYRQAGVAAGDGIKAALDAANFLQEHGYTTKVAQSLEPRMFDDFMEGSMPVDIIKSPSQLDEMLKKSRGKGPVVIDFYAPYCPSCMRMIPVVETVAYQLAEKAVFYKIDVSESPELAKEIEKRYQKQNVRCSKVPALMVLNDGDVVEQRYEALNKKQLHDVVNRCVKV